MTYWRTVGAVIVGLSIYFTVQKILEIILLERG